MGMAKHSRRILAGHRPTGTIYTRASEQSSERKEIVWNMTRGVLLQFRGQGRVILGGVTEYMTFHSILPDEDESDIDAEAREPAPGFTLMNEQLVVLPLWFPEEAILIEGA